MAHTAPHPKTQSLPVEVHWRLQSADGVYEGKQTEVFSPKSWRERLATVCPEFRRFGCLLSGSPVAAHDCRKDEHIVLQGLGTRWVYLPPGVVGDSLNHASSKFEQGMLRDGWMGLFRPLYQTRRTEKTVSGANGTSITIRQAQAGPFEVHVRAPGSDSSPGFIGDGLPGRFEVRLPMQYPKTMDLSVSIAKSAYLMFAVVAPPVALSPKLDSLRSWLAAPSEDGYRPVLEQYIPGAYPGFEYSFLVEGELGSSPETLPNVERVFARVRWHHMQYSIPLLGAVQVPPAKVPDGAEWFADPLPRRSHAAVVNFHFTRAVAG